jgi:hypothetical protein
MTIEWNSIPKHTILGSTLSEPFDISKILKQFKIRKYLYRIVYNGIVIKYGMSADNSRNYGERLYRQIGHCKSWGPQRLTGSSGSDFRITEEDFKNLHGYDIDHTKLVITVYNCSNYSFKTISPWDELEDMETFLIKEYVNLVGCRPIGNINDDANIRRKPKILNKTWNGLFE